MATILASLSVAGKTPGVVINLDRAAAGLPYQVRPGLGPGGLELRRPYEPGKVPVV